MEKLAPDPFHLGHLIKTFFYITKISRQKDFQLSEIVSDPSMDLKLYYGPKLVEPWFLSTSSTFLCVLCNKTSNLREV